MSFVMLDKPLLRAIMWDKPSFDAMREAAHQAARNRQPKFTVDLGKRYRRVEFNTGYAHDVIAQLAPTFDAPPKVYPPNLEGEEP